MPYIPQSPLVGLLAGMQQTSNPSLDEARRNAEMNKLRTMMLWMNDPQSSGGAPYMMGGSPSQQSGGGGSMMSLEQGKDMFDWLKKLFRGGKPENTSAAPPSSPVGSLDFTSTLDFTPGTTGINATGAAVAPTMRLYYPEATGRKPLSRQR